MAKRLTLPDLIDYVVNNCVIKKTDPDGEQDQSIIKKESLLMENITFKNLSFGESKKLNDLPSNLKEIFDPFINSSVRYGLVHKNDKEQNISLLCSLTYLLFTDKIQFDKIGSSTEAVYNKMMKDFVGTDIFTKKNYKQYGWQKKDLQLALKEHRNNRISLQYLVDYFNINIFYLNVAEDRLYCVCSNSIFNMYQMSVFLTYYEDVFEPVIFSDKPLLDFRSDVMKKILNVDKLKIAIMSANLSTQAETIIFQIGGNDLSQFETKQEEKPIDHEDNKNMFCEVDAEHTETDVLIDDPETEKIEPVKEKTSDIFLKLPKKSSTNPKIELHIGKGKKTKVLVVDSELKDEDLNIDSDVVETVAKYTREELSKMTVAKLHEIAIPLHISLSSKDPKTNKYTKKKKDELITEILNF